MNRYQKMVEYLDAKAPESRRLCPNKGPCACVGCVSLSSLTIRQRHLDMYKSGELQKLASAPDIQGGSDG